MEPTFSSDLGALRVLWKACAVCPTWLDTVPLPDAVFRWKELIPEAPRVIEKFGWSFRADVLQRTDRENTIRSLRPGFDGFPCVIEWVRQRYRQQTALGSARVSRRLRRDDPECATGLDVSATGAGGSCWHYNAGGDFDPQHARWKCICGKKRHITWNCPGASHLRQRLSLPTNRAAERLLDASCPEKPPAPPALNPGNLFDALLEELQRIMQTHPAVYLASDGSEDKSVGAFALALAPFVCSAGNGDEDQTPYKQELLAFHLAASCSTWPSSPWTARPLCARLLQLSPVTSTL